jgi:hypothetical protein
VSTGPRAPSRRASACAGLSYRPAAAARGPGASASPTEEVVGGLQQQRRRPAPGRGASTQRRDLLDLAAAPDAQVGDGEALDAGGAVHAGHERRPEALEIQAERRGDTGREHRHGLAHRAPHTS